MGLIALAGFIFSAIVFYLIVPRLVRKLIGHYVADKKLARRIYVPCILLSIVLIWCAFNAKKLTEQVVMNIVSYDCRWKEYKTVNDVQGIFIDNGGAQALDPDVYNDRNFWLWYRAYENANNATDLPEKYYLTVFYDNSFRYHSFQIPKRTFRYGIRSKYELVFANIIRITDTLMDFDQNEVLAKNIGYRYAPVHHLFDMKDLLLFFLFPYTPSGECGLDDEVNKNRYTHVLQPRKADLSPDEISVLVGPIAH